MFTAVAPRRLVPKAPAIPTVRGLQSAIASPRAEVKQRKTAEQSLSVTLASIEAGFIATDDQGRVTRMNEVAEKVTGWPQDEARGRGLWEVFEREARDAAVVPRNPVDVMSELGVTIDRARHMVCIARGGSGRTPLEVKAAVKQADDGSVRGIAMVFRDMTRTNITVSPIRDAAGRIVGASRSFATCPTSGGPNWPIALRTAGRGEPADPGVDPAEEPVPGRHVARSAPAQ